MVDPSKIIKDAPTVTSTGASLHQLPAGVTFRDAVTHTDDRGTVCEMYDPRWPWHPEPFRFAYFYTLRPGKIKGWGLHKRHEDRYFIMFGEMEIVMYDARSDSPTKGLVAKVVLSEVHRRLMNIPAGIWHANHNIGSKDVVVVNFPTLAYEHEDPDKYRLPLDTDQIPYSFSNRQGW
ncbi:MAG: dTDP-4-dehydrorhamnose 3,5-epimerase family protein [Vicinamibacterales bacterium]